ncbi:MAG: glycosyltransferase family 4 protein [Deltaproteobacteria bacterium]|nr:glycosyltransferase family 4 protein [Deltaproteobacteria bacterium]
MDSLQLSLVYTLVATTTSTGLITYLLLQFGLLSIDTPGQRSSHSTPTPRGGGLSFVLIVSSYLACLLFIIDRKISDSLVIVLICGIILATVGLADDRRSVSKTTRFLFQLTLSIVVVLWGLTWGDLEIFGVILPESVSPFLTVLWIMWVTNTFNFMDGINGMASLNGIIFATVLAVLAYANVETTICLLLLAIAGSLIGFLPFNFPKAKVFMGDCGSLFLGFLFATIPLIIHSNGHTLSALATLAIYMPFLFDTSFTILIRFIKKENIFEAHRTHIYQRLATRWGHGIVTLLYSLMSTVGGVLTIYKAS